MSQHTPVAAPAPHRRFSFARLRCLAAAAGLAGFAPVAPCADPSPPTTSAPGLSDIVLARSALAALDAEAELRGINLVVSVVDGVAVIGGPVPSAGASKRAERIVRAVEGMKDVRNTCFVSTGPDPLLKAVAVKSASTLPPRPVMGELPGLLGSQPPAPVSPFPPKTVVAAAETNSTVVAQKPALAAGGPSNILGAPVGPAEVPHSPSMPSTAPGTLTSVPANGLLAAAGEMKKSEGRFANLTVDLQGGVLVVGGFAPRAADAWDFAQKLRRMPGVTRVAVGAVAGK